MVFDNFFSFIENFGFYILSLVFTFKSFRVSEGWLVSRSTCFCLYLWQFTPKKFVVPERGFLILFPQSLSPLAETVVYFF